MTIQRVLSLALAGLFLALFVWDIDRESYGLATLNIFVFAWWARNVLIDDPSF
jgi:hypothetical protein